MRASGALEAVERILNRGGEPEDVRRAVVAALHERGGVAWAAIAVGPGVVASGGPEPAEPERRPIVLAGRAVGELRTAPGGEAALLDRVAVLVSPYCRAG